MWKWITLLCLGLAFVIAEEDAFNLGDLGAQGLPLEKKELKKYKIAKGKTGIRITSITPSGPADTAGLTTGTIIIGAGKGMFSSKQNPLHALLLAMEATSAKKKGNKLTLIVTDGTKTQKINVNLEYTGKHSSKCPKKCDRCTLVVKTGLEFLKSQQEENGGLPSKMMNMQSRIAITSLAGLAFLGTGSSYDEGEYAEQIRGCAKFIIDNVFNSGAFPKMPGGGKEGGSKVLDTPKPSGSRGNWNQENWSLSYAPLFLAELYKRSPRPEILALLQQIGNRLLKNQEATGGWAHGPGGPNALNYLELEVMSNWALASYGMMKSLGLEFDEEKLNKAVAYVVECGTGDGGIAYSTRPGQAGHGEVGRTGGATFAFQMLKLHRHPYYKPLTKYLKRNMKKTATGHVSPVMHYLAVGIASYNVSPAYWKQFMALFRNEFMLCRDPQGSFNAVPTEESKSLKSNCDRGLGPNWATASYLILLQIPNKKYKLLISK